MVVGSSSTTTTTSATTSTTTTTTTTTTYDSFNVCRSCILSKHIHRGNVRYAHLFQRIAYTHHITYTVNQIQESKKENSKKKVKLAYMIGLCIIKMYYIGY